MISFRGRERRAKVRGPSTDMGSICFYGVGNKRRVREGDKKTLFDREKDGVYNVMETKLVQVSRRQCPLVSNASDLSRKDAGFSNKNIIGDL